MAIFRRKKRSDHRRVYRVAARSGISVRPFIDGQQIPAQLIDVNGTGAGLFVKAEDAELFENELIVELAFALAGEASSVRGKARVAWTKEVVSDLGPGKQVGLQFMEVDDLQAQLTAGHWRFFNRRKYYRVGSATGSVPMQVAFERGRLEGWLVDLSASGFALEFPRTIPVLALPGHGVTATFVIPGSDVEAEFHAAIIYRIAREETIRIGFSIDSEQSPDFGVNEQLIVSHIVNSQRELSL